MREIQFLLFVLQVSLQVQAQSRPCSNSTAIAQAVQESNIIFTGKILELNAIPLSEFEVAPSLPPESSSYYYYSSRKRRRAFQRSLNTDRWTAKVKVKTVFKGRQGRDSDGQILDVVIGDGKYNENCPVRRLRALDTRVFFYAFQNGAGEFESKLTRNWLEILMPLPPTLAVLSAVRRILKDEPCATKECPFGGVCSVEGGVGVCKCVEFCTTTYTPVCGSDGVTYSSECQIKRFACNHHTYLEVKHTGECDKVDPCVNKICLFGSRCVSVDGNAICQCIKCDAPEAGELVCGSNGIEYGSKCQLEAAACEAGKHISIKYEGKCDPCSAIQCPSPSTCQLSEVREASCNCGFPCESEYSPICASDGKTYNSECDLKRESCLRKEELGIIYRGHCSSGVNPCELVYCRQLETCLINESGVAECSCNFNCPPMLRLVCGTDGITYDSECELKANACRLARNVTVAYVGSCELCADVQCKFGGHCVAGSCICPNTCPSTSDPVCGSNSITYQNECELQKFSCHFDTTLRVSHYGECIILKLPGVPNSDITFPGSFGFCANCHRLGSVSCDNVTESCVCRSGVGGDQCDRCLEGYWALHQIDMASSNGCQRCECSSVGSVREDCDQTTGKCECKDGFMGRKCEACAESPGSFGCVTVTEAPFFAQWSEYTEAGDEGHFEMHGEGRGNGVKSTRHLQQIPAAHRPTPVTFMMRSYLGESCLISSECVAANSICFKGTCVCEDGFHADADRILCRAINSHRSGAESCSKVSCGPSSTCFDFHNGSYACACPLGESHTNGVSCSKASTALPFFDGSSWIGLGKLGGNHKLSIEISITPLYDHAHGILVYGTEKQDGVGKFISLALIDGYVEFRFDLGGGTAILRSSGRLDGGSTYEVMAKRYNRDGLLRIDEIEEVQGSSPGSLKAIDLSHGGFLGYVSLNSTRVWESVGTSAGYVGCVHKLTIARRPVDFEEGNDSALDSFQGIHQCFPKGPFELSPFVEEPLALSVTQNPCLSSPCQNNGECWDERLNGFKCVCHPQFSGRVCEVGPGLTRETGATLDFRGFSYLQLPKMESSARQFDIELWFWPRSGDGLLLYSGQNEGRGDFVALVLTGGFLSFIFDLGSGSANITWPESLPLYRWHWIVAVREGRQGRLQVNGGVPALAKSPPTLSELNLELPLYVGGVPNENILVRELGFPEPFDGTLQRISVDGETYKEEIEEGLREQRLQRYEGPPCGSSVFFPCYNGGSCFPRLNNFVCICPAQFTGLNCQIRKFTPGPIRFNGKTFLKFPRKAIKRNKVQRRNEIEILFKTNSESSSVLVWIGRGGTWPKKGRRGYLGLFIVEGFPELRVDLGPPKDKKPIVLRSRMHVGDGRWHQILIVRRRRLLVFQVDGATPQRATSPVGSNVLVSDGQLWIGGIGDTVFPPEIPPSYHSGFRGCVDVLKVDKRRVPLGKVALAKGLSSCAKEDD